MVAAESTRGGIAAVVAIHASCRRLFFLLSFFSFLPLDAGVATLRPPSQRLAIRKSLPRRAGSLRRRRRHRHAIHITPGLAGRGGGVQARSHAPRSRARVCYHVAPTPNSLARAAYYPATTTPRRATRSTDTGQNGARHCPATLTPEGARSDRAFERSAGGWGDGETRGGWLPTSRCGA